MNTVIIVGAGATLAESLPSHPAKEFKPPLDATFFRLCKSAKLEGRGIVGRYLKKEYGLDPFSHQYSMEELFNLIYSDAISGNSPDISLEAYWSLLKMYRNAIMKTTNSLFGKSRSGVGHLFRFLVRTNSQRKITFVTFNHDLVIEKAIDGTVAMNRYSFVPWNLFSAYGLNFPEERFASKRGGIKFVFDSDGGSRSIKVFKLHGSLNWVYPVRSVDDARNVFRRPRGDLRCVNDKAIYRTLNLVGEQRSQPLQPLIVPPVYEKSDQIAHLLKPIWVSAQDAIASADELIVFGYSLPDADIPAKGLIRRGFFQNNDLQLIHVIDIDPNIASKFSSYMGAPAMRHYRTVKDFCRTNTVA